MLRPHLAVASRAVLQIVAVAVLSEPLPLGGHLGRRLHEVVLRPEIVGVVGRVNLLNVVQKAFERLSIAVLIEQGRERLVQLVERLHAREDIVGASEPSPHGVGHRFLI